ncbi:MAG: hypothetical protein AAFN91_10345 [Pseudomonadota bacterium]
MAKRQPLKFGTPKGDTGALDQLDERPDVVAKAVEEVRSPATPAPANDKPKKRQKSREDMVSINVWMSEDGRFVLKMHAQNPKTGPGKETMESFVIRAVNELLVKEGSDLEIQ